MGGYNVNDASMQLVSVRLSDFSISGPLLLANAGLSSTEPSGWSIDQTPGEN